MGEVQAQRQVAVKCNVATILKGRYVKEEGWNPNYVDSPIGRISRAHLVGVVVQQVNEQEFLIDDGSGKLTVRAFNMDNVVPPVGQLIRLIGRPREYQDMRYVLPEIIKHLDNAAWSRLHQAEVKKLPAVETSTMTASEAAMVEPNVKPAVSEAIQETPVQHASPEAPVEQVSKPGGQDTHTIIYTLIKNLDEGNGADYEQVVQKANLDKGEEIVETLLKEGEIFLIAPGKLKVLE
ncbi:MAG: hypothetical protein ACE5FT_03490 [Candidatus Nanoarchaeia archaeon]